jgi:hypothetical protein
MWSSMMFWDFVLLIMLVQHQKVLGECGPANSVRSMPCASRNHTGDPGSPKIIFAKNCVISECSHVLPRSKLIFHAASEG